jgi:hypothetical protein
MKTKFHIIILFTSFAFIFSAHADKNPNSTVNSHTRRNEVTSLSIELGETQIIGKLGRPLGTPLIINCLVEVKTSTTSSGLSTYLLSIESVNGTKLENVVKMEFFVPMGVFVNVAENSSALDKLATRLGTPGGTSKFSKEHGYIIVEKELTKPEVSKFIHNYLNSRHSLLVYETGGFFGAPTAIPIEYEANIAGMRPFQFKSRLIVIAET